MPQSLLLSLHHFTKVKIHQSAQLMVLLLKQFFFMTSKQRIKVNLPTIHARIISTDMVVNSEK